MRTTQKSKWWVEAVLFIGFIIAYTLDWTGLDLHQWIGVSVGLLAAYHLLTHWNWIKTVTRRFIGQTSKQARLYYLVDAAILAGFATITGTGVVISTWLNLSLTNYLSWRFVHIAVSIGTLLLVLVKIFLHWRWIATTARNILTLPFTGDPRLTSRASMVSRRELLKVMGVVGLASALALKESVLSLASSINTSSQAVEPPAATLVAVDSTLASTATTSSQIAASTSPQSTATQIENSTSPQSTATQVIPTNQPTSTTASVAAATTCQVLCNRGCSYPGRCRRYVDTNSNNRCDLGECL